MSLGADASSDNNPQSVVKEIHEQLKPLITSQSPFDEIVETNTPATWVKPVIVCEVKFTEKTRGGKLRHPIFVRIRDDKSVEDITVASTRTVTKKQAEIERTAEVTKDLLISFGRLKVPVTHWDKLFWPEEKIT